MIGSPSSTMMRARDEHRAGREARRKTAGDAETDDGAGVGGGGMEIAGETGAVAPAREGMNPRPGGELAPRP